MSRPLEAQEWDKRKFISCGPTFRIDTDNPQMGNGGTCSWMIYGATDKDGDKSSLFQTTDGTLHLHSDKKLEIAAGGDGNEKDDDITITALKGGVSIIANENGSVTIKAQNILLEADNDIDLRGKNINLNARGGKVDIAGLKATVSAKLGNLPRTMGIDFAKNAFEGSFVGPDFLADKLGGALPELANVGNTFAGKLESQIADLDIAGNLDKIDTGALQNQLKGQLGSSQIKNLLGGFG